MSAIAAIVEATAASEDSSRRRDADLEVRAMAGAAPRRADSEPTSSFALEGPVACMSAAARTLAGERPLVAAGEGIILVADASLVRRAALRRALAAARVPVPEEPDDAELLFAAWRAWGEGMVRRVDGDFAFVLWDARQRLLIASRDFVGRRPLHWAHAGGTMLLGSTPGVVLAHPKAPRVLNPDAIAAAAGALLEHPDETAWRGIHVLQPGHLLSWSPGEAARVRRVWEPPVFERGPSTPFPEAAQELRRLLVESAAERMDGELPAAVWLSGGWDSPAVYGAARASGRDDVLPVSMSYPVGDGGREDETIASIAGAHASAVHWASVSDAPLVGPELLHEVEEDDEPFVHPYRGWNRRLAAVTRAAGAGVALDGAGGDQLFGVSPVFVAQLLRQGRFVEARRAARAHGAVTGRGRQAATEWWRWGVRPLLSPQLLSIAGLLRGGRAPLGHLERVVPGWLIGRGRQRESLRRRARGWSPRRGESLGAAESRWYLTSSYSGRILAAQSAEALAEGVVLRSPLLDSRVIALAATRPREERAADGETKRLLRSAAADWLPREVLSTRTSRTGLSTDYFRRELRMSLPNLLAMAGDMDALAGMGVVEPTKVSAAASDWLEGRAGDEVGLALLCTLRTELWTRGRLSGGGVQQREVTVATGAASNW